MLLIDGDIICYRSVFSKEAESVADFLFIADLYVRNIIKKADNSDKEYKVFLTGKGNFRSQVAVTAPYKGNRPTEKPEHLETIRQHLLDYHPSTLSSDEEADDMIAIEATQRGSECVVCSIDKDLDQIPGKHYNFVKDIRYTVTPWDGLVFFYSQILTGDRIDNVIGIRGIGPAKASKALKDCTTEQALFDRCVEMFEGDTDRVIENGKLLWLRRSNSEIWLPPTHTEAQVSEKKRQDETPEGI
jgi:5'-3' exonuclease